jgi:acetoin utilization deacetylase AcuC-like enzyme
MYTGNVLLKFLQNPNVFTFSTHGRTNYHFKETSDLDIAFDDNTSDDEFLKIISAVIPKLSSKPDFIFYLAGVDILASDKLGKLNCLQGCKKETNWFSNFVHNTKFSQVSMVVDI